MNKEYLFLKEYEELCKKYKMGLKGCGCCGSPFLNEICDINYNEKLDKIVIGGQGDEKLNPKFYLEFYKDGKLKEFYIEEYFKAGDNNV